MQQSGAFKILRTRLKTVPPHSFSGVQFRHTPSGNRYSQNSHMSGSDMTEDGEMNDDSQNVHNGMNFTSRLQQFEQMRQRHRIHSKSQATVRKSSTSSSKVCCAFYSLSHCIWFMKFYFSGEPWHCFTINIGSSLV